PRDSTSLVRSYRSATSSNIEATSCGCLSRDARVTGPLWQPGPRGPTAPGRSAPPVHQPSGEDGGHAGGGPAGGQRRLVGHVEDGEGGRPLPDGGRGSGHPGEAPSGERVQAGGVPGVLGRRPDAQPG